MTGLCARGVKSKKRFHPAAAAITDVHFHPAATRPQPRPRVRLRQKPKPNSSTCTSHLPKSPSPRRHHDAPRVDADHARIRVLPDPLVPLLELSALHVYAERHAARVRALFEQLDTALAWDRDAMCEALRRRTRCGCLVRSLCGVVRACRVRHTQGGRDGVVALGSKRCLAAPKPQLREPATMCRTSSVTDEDGENAIKLRKIALKRATAVRSPALARCSTFCL
jgi:hypothetical protein